MALAASSPTDAPGAPGAQGTRQRHSRFGVATWLVAALVCLGALLAILPEGMAEPLQTVIAWLMVAMVAILAVILVAKGLERLLDCESS